MRQPRYSVRYQACEKKKPIAWLVGGIEDLERYGKMVPDFAFAWRARFGLARLPSL